MRRIRYVGSRNEVYEVLSLYVARLLGQYGEVLGGFFLPTHAI